MSKFRPLENRQYGKEVDPTGADPLPRAKRPTLTLQAKEANAAPDVAGDGASLPPDAALAASDGKSRKDKPITKLEWKEFHPQGGASTKITIDANDIAFLIEGADNLKGRTIIAWKNAMNGTAVLDHPFTDVRGWVGNLVKHAWKDFLFPDGKRRLTVTRTAISSVGEVENEPISILRFRAKGAKAVPIASPYSEVAAWVNERKKDKAASE
jgi:hypothetical protein